MNDRFTPTYKRVIQDKEPPVRVCRKRPSSPCPNLCGRATTTSACCRTCQAAFAEGYYLSPGIPRTDTKLPGRAEKLAEYARRAAAGESIFQGNGEEEEE